MKLNNFDTEKFLKPSDELIKYKRILGFDIETYSKHNLFLMGSIVNDKEKYVFWNKKDMQDFVLKSKKVRNSRLFATNLQFDFLALFGDRLEEFEYLIRAGNFISVKYDNNNVLFMDSMNFFKKGVSNIGKIINLPKMKHPECLGKIPKNEKERLELEIYNINDSMITYKFMDYLQHNFNKIGCNLKYTIASTSLGLFRNKYLKYYILQPKKEILKTMYKAYYGGRTEAFYRGTIKDIFYYDINSLYPSVMKDNLFPDTNNLKISNNPNMELIKKFDGISECITINNNNRLNYPLLPFRKDNKLLFPLGKFKSWQTHIELRKALSLGYKIKPLQSIYTTKNINLFDKFVSDLYNARLKNKDIELVYKILLNSLYGKFGQTLEYSNIYFVKNQIQKDKVNKFFDTNRRLYLEGKPSKYKIESPDKNRIYIKNGVKISEPRIYYVTDLDKKYYPKFINPILSLYITSYSRLKLYDYFEKVMAKDGIIYYCDTDSIFTDIKIPVSSELGKLKLEAKIKEGILVKPKFYYFKTKDNKEIKEIYKIKGIMGLNSYKDFINILDKQVYKYKKFSKFKESIRRNLNFNEILDIEKNIDLMDNKRKWNNNRYFDYKVLEKSKPLFI